MRYTIFYIGETRHLCSDDNPRACNDQENAVVLQLFIAESESECDQDMNVYKYIGSSLFILGMLCSPCTMTHTRRYGDRGGDGEGWGEQEEQEGVKGGVWGAERDTERERGRQRQRQRHTCDYPA